MKSQRLYGIWKGIKRRCLNANYHHFSNYGGRGIKLCDDWKKSYHSFESWALSHGYEDSLSIERIDTDKGYFPDNCTWETSEEQNNNTRRNHYVEFRGGLYTIAELSKMYGIKQNTLLYRLRRGWGVDRAVTTEVQKHG